MFHALIFRQVTRQRMRGVYISTDSEETTRDF
uniref:Uncharacterized protein n=1 Tax=Anguilla anguilla TaxID=7936 RepID=A0A0E9PS38_ANGAN